MGDQLRLENVLTQFLIHAAKAAPSHSQIKVHLVMKVGKPMIPEKEASALPSPRSLPIASAPVVPVADNAYAYAPAGVAGVAGGGGGGGAGKVTDIVSGATGHVHLQRADRDDEDNSSGDNLLQLVQGPLLPSAPTSPPPGD